jgi:hypothetical protein
MTIEGIIRMAKQAGFADEEIDTCQQIFIHFAKLVAQHEREACAKICDDWPNGRDDIWEIGNAIRARGQA